MNDAKLDLLQDCLLRIFLKSYKEFRYLHKGELLYRLSQESGYPITYIKRQINAMVQAGLVSETVDDSPRMRFTGRAVEAYLGCRPILAYTKLRQEKIQAQVKTELGAIL